MSKIKSISIFALGFAAGAFFMNRYLNNKLESSFQEEIDAMEDFYNRKALLEETNIKDTIKENVKNNTEVLVKKFRSTVDKEKYNKMFIDDSFDTDDVENQNPPEDKSTSEPPYIISQNEETPFNYTRVTLTYYINADILSEDDTIVDNPDYVVGREFKNIISSDNFEEDSVLVRNEKLSTDFEIILDYSDKETVKEILGYEDLNEE